MAQFLKIVSNPDVYTTVQGLFLVLALARYIWPLARRNREIAGAVRVARIIAAKEKDPNRIRQRIGQEVFKAVPWAQTRLKAFLAAWRDACSVYSDRAEAEVYIEDYITADAAVRTSTNQRTAEALPGVFLALGILGTFLGIVVALRDFPTSGSPDDMRMGIREIVAGLQLAFRTSLVGIASSVFFSLVHKRTLRRIDLSLREIASEFRVVFPCATAAVYARKLLDMQADIKAQMQTLATDIATQVAHTMEPAMSKAVGDHLAPIMIDLQEIMAAFVESSAKNQVEAVDRMLNEYVERMQATFSTEIADISQLIKDTSSAQRAIAQELDTFSDSLRRQFAAQGELIEKTTSASRLLNESLESLTEIAGSLRESAGDVSAAAELLSSSARLAQEAQQQLLKVIEAQLTAMHATREGLESTWHEIATGLSSASSHTTDLVDRIAVALGENLTSALNSFDDKLSEVIDRFSGTLSGTRDSVDELPSLIGDLSGTVDSISTDIAEFKQAVSELKAMTQNLVAPNLAQAAGVAQQLRDLAAANQATAEQLKAAGTSASMDLSPLIEMNSRLLASVSSGAERITSQVDNGIVTLTSAIEKLQVSNTWRHATTPLPTTEDAGAGLPAFDGSSDQADTERQPTRPADEGSLSPPAQDDSLQDRGIEHPGRDDEDRPGFISRIWRR